MKTWNELFNIKAVLSISLLLRIGFILLGRIIDSLEEIQLDFTDIDYSVFEEGSKLLLRGKSPYLSPTYRYSPLIAILNAPSCIFPEFGKLIFSIADVGCVWLIYIILSSRWPASKPSFPLLCCSSWGLNPLLIVIPARGSADPISNFFVFLAIWNMEQEHFVFAGLCTGFMIHLRLYPIIYLLPFSFNILLPKLSNERYRWGELFKFLLSTGLVLAVTTFGFYCTYGWDYLNNSILYHLVRSDYRHNFSSQFLGIYLNANNVLNLSTTSSEALSQYPVDMKSCFISFLWKLTDFLPQLLIMIGLSLRFSKNHLSACMLLQTMVFVTFNKVITAQYFTWYACLLPLAYSSFSAKLSLRTVSVLMSAWLVSMLVWLFEAYLLEFCGKNSFFSIWVASIVFFVVNVLIIVTLISHID